MTGGWCRRNDVQGLVALGFWRRWVSAVRNRCNSLATTAGYAATDDKRPEESLQCALHNRIFATHTRYGRPCRLDQLGVAQRLLDGADGPTRSPNSSPRNRRRPGSRTTQRAGPGRVPSSIGREVASRPSAPGLDPYGVILGPALRQAWAFGGGGRPPPGPPVLPRWRTPAPAGPGRRRARRRSCRCRTRPPAR